MKRKSFLLAALLAISSAPTISAAQGVSLASGFTDFTSWNLYGSATASNITPGDGFTYSNMALTQGLGDEAGAGFAPDAITLDFNQAFTFDFHFVIPTVDNTTERGDGLTFTLAGAPGLGIGGSELGYGGGYGVFPDNSVAFAIDTFSCCGEPVSPSLQILTGGSINPVAYTETGLDDSIRYPSFQWYASVAYTPSGNDDNAGTLTGSLQRDDLGTFSVSAMVDFAALYIAGHPVYYGFTAANGYATDQHVITSAMPVPEPETWAMLLAGLVLLGVVARHRRQNDV
jgi:hypothetical protein